VGAALIHEDRQTYGRTDMMKLIDGFGDYADAPKIGYGIVL
jgi:hypothetical protein